MPVVIKKQTMAYRDTDGNYVFFNAVAQEGTKQQLAEIAAAGAEQIANMEQTVNDALQEAKDSGEFDGPTGPNGATFMPTVNSAGVISWTNNGGLPNPQPQNIMGPEGKQGPQGAPGVTPVRGVDYWTSADVQNLTDAAINAVLDAYPAAEGEGF